MSIPFIGDIIKTGGDLIKSYFPPDLSPEQKAKLEAGIQQYQLQMQTSLQNYNTEIIKQQGAIVQAEAKSESWLASNWRPITMLTFVLIIANNYILFPYIQLFGGTATALTIPPDMWDLLKLGLGGYVVGRSVEKAVKNYTLTKQENRN
jgi:hypothetical protein